LKFIKSLKKVTKEPSHWHGASLSHACPLKSTLHSLRASTSYETFNPVMEAMCNESDKLSIKIKFELSRSAKITETFHEDLAKLKVV
jgi:hypothetical protein